MAEPRDHVSIRSWDPGVPGIREVFHARFDEHAYPLHTHDVWTLFIVDRGAVRYDLHLTERAAEPSMVSVLPPHVAHDGRPATPDGYRMRVLYVEADALGAELIGAAVDRPVIADAGLRAEVAALHDALACVDDRLDAETRFAFVTERIRSSLGAVEHEAAGPPTGALADEFRDWLDAHLFDAGTLAQASIDLDASPTRLARSFTSAFAITPHAYVTGRRLEVARGRILEGRPLAEVAAEAGFADQAHLTRRFREFLGTTPGRFRG